MSAPERRTKRDDCIDEMRESIDMLIEKMDYLTSVIEGNGKPGLIEQAHDNTEFRKRWEPKLDAFPAAMVKMWIGTMLTIFSMVLGIVYFVVKVI